MKPAGSVYPYPTSPVHVDEKILEPSIEFRSEAFGVLRMIFMFVGTYFLLVAAAIALAVFCAWGGIWIMGAFGGWFAILIGVGLIGMGLMVLFFLFKFIFKSTTIDQSSMIEVTEREEPVLFDFIRKLAAETKTPLPKRVFLSPDVNACVFYNSSFWSMFLPVKKNLNIGLGLVNAVNVSEFKAVIAHEFGHFSQRSMKLGSYVYHVNHILHDMLYDNSDYGRTLETWASFHHVFYFFAEVTSAIVRGMIEILQSLYARINERYMALSRQMEFHADAVAASVSGSMPLVTALNRLELAQNAYQTVLGWYSGWVAENRKGRNVYKHHTCVMKNVAQTHGLPVENDLVQVSAEAFGKYKTNRVVIKDQWASHPETAERERHLTKLNLDSEQVKQSAWVLFSQPEKLQERITEQLYETVTFSAQPEIIDAGEFQSLYAEQKQKYSLGEAYKGFYDNRNISVFNPEVVSAEQPGAETLSDILTDQVLNLQHRIKGLEVDIRLLEEIRKKRSNVETFDFEGTRYSRDHAKELIVKLTRELKEATATLENTDKDIFRLYCRKSGLMGKEKEAVNLYKELFEAGSDTERMVVHTNAMLREAGQLFQGAVNQDSAMAITANMKRERERMKSHVRELTVDPKYSAFYSDEEKNTLAYFARDRREYLTTDGFDPEAITLYINALQIYARIVGEYGFMLKKKTLDAQLRALESESVASQTNLQQPTAKS